MTIQIRYFASLREALGAGETLALEPGAPALTVGALRAPLNQTMCAETAEIADGAEVAFFPPVTGG